MYLVTQTTISNESDLIITSTGTDASNFLNTDVNPFFHAEYASKHI